MIATSVVFHLDISTANNMTTFNEDRSKACPSIKADHLSNVIRSGLQVPPDKSSEYPPTCRVAIIMCSIYITMFLIALICRLKLLASNQILTQPNRIRPFLFQLFQSSLIASILRATSVGMGPPTCSRCALSSFSGAVSILYRPLPAFQDPSTRRNRSSSQLSQSSRPGLRSAVHRPARQCLLLAAPSLGLAALT